MNAQELEHLMAVATPQEAAEFAALMDADRRLRLWVPLPGPQTQAYESEADIIGYGGSAGSGKSSLAVGLILTKHRRSLLLRKERAQTHGILQDIEKLLGGTDGYNSQSGIWRLPGDRVLTVGGLANPGDERRYQGRPNDLIVLDEAAEQNEDQCRFVMGWNRSEDPAQKCRVLMTFNPPTTAEGRWIVSFFGPWIDKAHSLYPTPAGKLLWAYMDTTDGKGGHEVFTDDPRPFVLIDGQRMYDIPPGTRDEAVVKPRSRTFIPARLQDNPYLSSTGYKAMLQALPEPLRSQMLYGDFSAGIEDDPWQVIPSAWVEAAVKRWREPTCVGEMLCVGVDVARGGRDDTAIVTRHAHDGTQYWFDRPKVHRGAATPDGYVTAALVMAARRDDAPICIDVIGVGASPYDIMRGSVQVLGVNVAEAPTETAAGGVLRFRNMRSQLWWKVRELLDPANNTGVCIPPDDRLIKELTTPKWEMEGRTVVVESRESIVKRGGASPDVATALILATLGVPKLAAIRAAGAQRGALDYDPLAGA